MNPPRAASAANERGAWRFSLSEFANVTYEEYNEVWEALDGGPCPAGHFCPPGTEDPVQCANASVRSGSKEMSRIQPTPSRRRFGSRASQVE